MENQTKPILEIQGLSKAFPGVQALDHVDFTVTRGEVHALVGENGAGKSTLMKTLAGIHTPDSGEILFQGNAVNFRHPLDAIEQGVILIFQELSLVPELTVAENVFLGRLPMKQFGLVDRDALKEKTQTILEKLGCQFTANDLVGNLSIGYQQMVEIAKALSHEARLIIFDEPTASLTSSEVDILFQNIKTLKEQGTAIIYISHKLDEVFEISDRISVLRDGKKTGTLTTADADRSTVINYMIGRNLADFFERPSKSVGQEILRVEGLCREGLVKDVSFQVKSGEVLGLYGLVGAGRSETVETIFGIVQPDSGKIFVEEREEFVKTPKHAVGLGMAFVPENRKEQGLILEMACVENLSLVKIRELQRFGFLKKSDQLTVFEDYAQKLSISTTGPRQLVVKLSGGNQQKIVMAKWMCVDPKLLILDEPTRGIDVGSKAEIHRLIGEMAKEGMAVIVISSEMPEIMGVSDRILTMCEGHVTGEFFAEDVTERKLMEAIAHKG